ncbi:hypothetical protein SIN8267_01212 [Sinobacterium norvegicum]|uniref:AAA family ATPase n=1 Tax=Sinobacterium norvegicum TaxID=1641715 RepID=A0ABM9AD37_9GAMM|nr:MoxR family ATPase [Sinobacterium norvegicum]CAH0991111.1 hypothetical protein SIN8267_01212 [Sinobacterium norvegicum]
METTTMTPPPQDLIKALKDSINQSIIGQQAVVDQLIIALLAEGHVLIQGLPGLAKTRAVSAMASSVDAQLRRIQFTPDMLPSDITGSEMFNSESQQLSFTRGPVFSNFVLADEINRAPAKVQSALLEAMAEAQVSVAGQSYPLPDLFMVLATQNPVEQEGTYPLPEAQMDRFLMQLLIDYPSIESEILMLQMLRAESRAEAGQPVISMADILQARRQIEAIHVSAAVDQYIVALVDASRKPQKYHQQLSKWIDQGASPRASIALDKAARATAWLAGRDFVNTDDVRRVIHPVLRHRISRSYTAIGNNISSDHIIDTIVDHVAWV